MGLNQLKQRNSAEILLLLLLSDLLVILAHIALHLSPSENRVYWVIDYDRGFGETFQYFKEFWLFCSFAILFNIRSEYSYLSLAALFLYFFVDDAFFVHERVGIFIAKALEFQPAMGLRPNDFGELIVSLTAGLFFFASIGCSYWLGSQRFRLVCKRVAVLVGCLAFFGIGVDMLHIISERVNAPFLPPSAVFELFEDGGEMLVMSVICWYGISQLRQQDSIAQDLPASDQRKFSPFQR